MRRMQRIFKILRKKKPKWALVLMGGGSRGLAHIGAINVLQKNGLTPPVVVGTSIGGLVGGLFASGFTPAELKDVTEELSSKDFLQKPNFPFLPTKMRTIIDILMLESYKNRLLRTVGFDRKDRMEEYLKSLVGETLIEDLPVKFACNAVDLISGKEVIFEKGKLYKALRATMSLPIVFEPARVDDMLLVDGGVLDNAPVEIARRLGAERTLLVDIHRPIKEIPAEDVKNTFQLIHRMVDTMIAATTEQKIKEADFVLRVDIDVDLFDFSDSERIIGEGEKAAKENINKIKKLVA
jgi:NTE family protein